MRWSSASRKTSPPRRSGGTHPLRLEAESPFYSKTVCGKSAGAVCSARRMQQRVFFSVVEVLENRIAPADLFVSSAFSGRDALTVKTVTGANAQDSEAENFAQTTAGSNAAVLLSAGDRLIFDSDNNHRLTN